MHYNSTYLGIDVGTLGLRKLLISAAGKPIGATETCYNTQNLYRGWSEQETNKLIVVLNSCINELKLKHTEFSRLNGMGLVAICMAHACWIKLKLDRFSDLVLYGMKLKAKLKYENWIS